MNRVTRRDLLTLLLILIVAGLLRLGEPGIVEFKHDEAWLSLLARDMILTGIPALTGIPSSVGIPNPPVSVYLMAVPFALSGDPVRATMFVAALNVLGVGLLWLLAHRYLGRTIALIAGLADAVSPWAILYSRKIWAQDLLAPFLLAALLLGLVGFVEGRRRAQLLFLPVFVLALQIHFAALTLVSLLFWLLWRGRRNVSRPALALSVALAALALVPYALGLSRTLAQDPGRIANALNRSRESITLNAEPLITYARFATGLGLETQVASEQSEDFLASVPPQAQVWALLGLLAALGFIVMWQARTRWIAPLLVLWIGVPLLAFTPAWTPVYPHYFIAVIPTLCLLMGIGLAWLLARLPGQPLSRTVVLTGFAVIALSQGIWWRGLLRYVAAVPTPFGFDTPLASRMPLRQALLPSSDVLVLVDDARLEYSQEPAIWSALLRDTDRCVRTLDSVSLLIIPAGPFVVAASADAPDELVALYRGESGIEYDLSPGAQHYTLYDQPATPDWPALEPVEARFAGGIHLAGYTLLNDGVALGWNLPAPVQSDYHYFIHLLDAAGERVAQHDAPFLPARYGCAGDRVFTTAPLDVPERAAFLRVGLYTLQGDRFVNSDALDDAGNAIAPWFDIPLTD